MVTITKKGEEFDMTEQAMSRIVTVPCDMNQEQLLQEVHRLQEEIKRLQSANTKKDKLIHIQTERWMRQKYGKKVV